MSQYFPKNYEPFGRGIDVKVDLSNYATKTECITMHNMQMLAALH